MVTAIYVYDFTVKHGYKEILIRDLWIYFVISVICYIHIYNEFIILTIANSP